MSAWAAFMIAIAAASTLGASAALAWDARPTGTGPAGGFASAVTTTPNGDVIAAGLLHEIPDGARFAVMRLDAATGAEQWRTIVPQPGFSAAVDQGRTAVAVDHAGDVLAAGQIAQGSFPATVVKLAGATGAEMWRYDLLAMPAIAVDDANDVYLATGGLVVQLLGATGESGWTYQLPGGTSDIVLLPDQDVVIAGAFDGTVIPTTGVPRITPTPVHGSVLRLDRNTGLPVWSTRVRFGAIATHVVATSNGDVFVAASDAYLQYPRRGGTSALSAATGAIRWNRDFDSVDAIAPTVTGDLAVLSAGAQGFDETDIRAYVLGRAGGTTLAERVIPPGDVGVPCGSPCFGTVATEILGDPAGDVYVVGAFRFFELVAARLGAPDLDDVWRRDGGSATAVPGLFQPRAAARSPTGSLVVAGAVRDPTGTTDLFAVLTFTVTGSTGACGDDTVDPGEACDDANRDDGDCCAADCAIPAPDGTACHDESVCTLGDHCSAGLCSAASRLPCEPCGVCYPDAGCYVGTALTCGRSTITNGASLGIERTRGGRDRFTWSLRSGPATSKQALGNPLATTSYAVCGSLPDGRVVLRGVAPAGPCGKRRCWRSTRRGFEYADDSAQDGLTRLSLRAAADGQTRFRARGARDRVLVPPLPVQGSLEVYLRRVDEPTTCWSSTLTTVTKNGARRFEATGE